MVPDFPRHLKRMATPRKSPIKVATLRDAFIQDLGEAWTYARAKHPGHTPYAFALYGVEGTPRLTPNVLTEQSLTQVAERYVAEGYQESLDEARAALRYSVPDSPLRDELNDRIPNVDAIVGPHEATLGETAGYDLLAKAAIEALKKLDAQGMFGKGRERERLLLIVVTEDTEVDWTTRSVRLLNPPGVVKRFAKETAVEGVFASCDSIAVALDGQSLYAAGSRANPTAKAGARNEFISELVSHDLVRGGGGGGRLARRWVFTLPNAGDSVRRVACTPDGRSLFALRTRYDKARCDTLVLRFSPDSDVPLAQLQIPGEPADLALAADGARLAVAMHDRSVHVVDAALRPERTFKLHTKPRSIFFLPSGEMLIGTDAGLLRLGKVADVPDTVATLAAFRLRSDDQHRVLAVSQWFPTSGPARDNPVEFGVTLLRLPSLEPVGTFAVPGHQAVTGTLSPDGRLLAVVAHEIGKPRKSAVVFDTVTGRDAARRKSGFAHDLAFLRDSRTLAISTSGYTKREPIEFFPVDID
jgi:hypothetical protein